ncbi:polysaccharide transporter, PST family [Methylobacterium sp. 190mf]|uniref:oligosaccharide flippase family protein n=1 Tax=Methylobacterium sp. 190mf TaxID=1761798 RepID=UPI00089ED407|nr:oligosaccharide flippase family protein [Methylobacterium sp. 190mf]SEG71208.1 polysaccharide transporter, PST family [Methylobacterium sp. 190mf]
MSSLAKNSVVGAILGGIKICAQLIALPVIAGFLGPKDFAVYALALPTVSFFLVLADAGVSGTLARENEANEVVWSSAFWAINGLCLLLQFLVIAIGYALSIVSGFQDLMELMLILSFSLPLMGLSNIPVARLYRRGRVQHLSMIDACSAIIGVMLGILSARAGFGPISLGVQFISGFLIRTIFVNYMAYRRPLFSFSICAIKSHLAVSTSIIGGRLAEFAGRTFENMVFQRTFGESLLGNYSLANQISRFACEAFTNPTWASLYAHSLHEERTSLPQLTRATIVAVCYVVFPIAALLASSASSLFSVVMGEKWYDAGWMVQTLIAFSALGSVFGLAGAVLTALGNPAAIFYATLILYISRTLSIAIGCLFGVGTSVLLVGASAILYSMLILVGARKIYNLNIFYCLYAVGPPFCASMLAGTISFLAVTLFQGSLLKLLAGYIFSMSAYLIVVILFCRKDLAPLFAIIDNIRRKGRSAAR